MMNVGENRAQNGVRMLPESRNEVENQIDDVADVGRYAPDQTPVWGDARETNHFSIISFEIFCYIYTTRLLNVVVGIKTMRHKILPVGNVFEGDSDTR
ncbi:hypothetical protein E3N88_32293 [Mikania micrantha]|uniref:Uncharacterized protein n=1 Tax=Mikania micrantha TaxID=192012 RepID=A0A5N6M834_9ASTR|nr:hypothetical protein E3N88_32293 [Mikania micrantha]